MQFNKKQPAVNISFDEQSIFVLNELNRTSALKYESTAKTGRDAMRFGLKVINGTHKLVAVK
tara:strand:+ start:374 stop:559 length:186 start_codon:yes stop_codon:yes gene_type:complete